MTDLLSLCKQLASMQLLCCIFVAHMIATGAAQTAAAGSTVTDSTVIALLTPSNDTGSCLQGCYKGDCGPGTDNYLTLASICDERLSQLWLLSHSNRQIINVASGYCVSITSADVVTMAACGSNDPAQTWTLYANGSLTPVSNPGSSLTTCTDGNPACDAKIEQLASNNGELVAIAYEQTPQTWEETPPSLDGGIIQSYWQSASDAGNASFTASVSASTPWCMQQCSNSDCGDPSLDSSLVVSSVCDERLNQMWYNDSSMIRSVSTDECVTICGITAAEAAASTLSEGNVSLAETCTGAGSAYYNMETRPCTGAANQLWQWQPTPVGSVMYNAETKQAVTVCSDLVPWCGYLLLLSFDSTWSARHLTATALPSSASAVSQFQGFVPAPLSKATAAGPQSSVPVSAESSDFSVPPAPAAPSEDTATIESFGDAEPVPVPEAVSDSSSNAYAPPPPTVTSAS